MNRKVWPKSWVIIVKLADECSPRFFECSIIRDGGLAVEYRFRASYAIDKSYISLDVRDAEKMSVDELRSFAHTAAIQCKILESVS